jgi:hypothetical protein
MNRYTRTAALLLMLAIGVSACAVRLGGPSPEEYDVATLFELRNADADAVVQRISESGAEIVLLAGERQDSAWFTYIAANARLQLSGPGATTGRGYAFMTSPVLELLGDTSLVLPVAGGGSVHMHDALYRIDDTRTIDLMLVRLEGPDLIASLDTLLGYIASDVPADAVLVLALDGPTPAAADSVAREVRVHMSDASACREEDGDQSAQPPVRLLYGPSARVSCLSARTLTGAAGIVARLQVGR